MRKGLAKRREEVSRFRNIGLGKRPKGSLKSRMCSLLRRLK
jgi:hypothetical protein